VLPLIAFVDAPKRPFLIFSANILIITFFFQYQNADDQDIDSFEAT
jgi:hypothetical protein